MRLHRAHDRELSRYGKPKENTKMITESNFTRAKFLDVNGNSRYILHFLALTKEGDAAEGDISGKYVAALARARKMGGRKYHNKQYGGGIIFQTTDTRRLAEDLNNFMRGPVVWDALWDAMKAAPGEWIETTEKMYWDMLEVLPPVRMDGQKILSRRSRPRRRTRARGLLLL